MRRQSDRFQSRIYRSSSKQFDLWCEAQGGLERDIGIAIAQVVESDHLLFS